MYVPTFEDVVAARDFIAKHLPKTPLVHLSGISDALGCEYYAKLENLQPVGAFKVRGGVNLVGTAEPADLEKGLVTASTGNHGQSIAFAGKLFGTKVVIYAPAENVNPLKLQAMRDLGAEVRLHGRDFDQARLETERASQVEGFRYVHSANEPKLISGVGTIGLEIFEDLSDVDVIIAPAGGGSCAAGNCLVAKKLNPQVQVIAVQSEAAPAMWHAWRNHSLEEFPTMNTRHEGLATRVPFELTNKILWKHLDDFVLVNDDEIDHAIGLLSTKAKQVTEGAGAASLAAAIKIQDRLRGKRVVGIVTGGNIAATTFAAIISNMD
jgi:threonine dehydratase